ncbi:transcription termination factor NusA [Tannerella forsythia]|uniref:Transcription termination/antitermination protein NusA n=1 Tax=Tannerella forsythia TaxID=28112 RepID=A0A3P1YWT7_TANFO|nr:transcription termination factor NusA [Tannerella forsythia]RRD75419.1 transcription termination/antitermination protein NusA [Tannerella forsythia]
MARRQETVSMIDTLQEFKELKSIDKDTMINVLEESFRNVIAKMFGTDENYDVIINPEKGDFEIWRNRMVVEDGHVEDPNLEVALSEAQKIDADCEVGEEVTDEVHFADFGRRAILNLRQTLASKILELQKDNLYAKYRDLIGSIVTADVYQVWKKEVLLLDDDGNELLLPKAEQIPSDFYRKGESVRAIVQRVDNDNNNTKIYLSRTDKVFLQRLFELEVPEINDGLITIKAIARIPGERAKIAVESYDDRIDPVGACVGMKGSRIRGIVRELRNENIDVINYTSNTSLFIQRALSPAKISSIRVDEEEHKAEVFLRPEEVSLAIGKNGLNIKLASMLTDYTIDVFRDIDAADEEDIYLDEFADEIDMWVIDALKNIGCNTAKAVLALSREEIMERADLEEQTVDDVLSILSSEFEDEEVSDPDFEPAEEEDSMDSEIDVPEPVSTEQDTENEEQEEEKE